MLQHGLAVFHWADSDENKESATRDLATLRGLYDSNPAMGFAVRCDGPSDKLFCLKFKSAFDVIEAQNIFGTLPVSWTVMRSDGAFFRIFEAMAPDPLLIPYRRIRPSAVKVMASCPLPGSMDAKTAQTFVWSPGKAPGECDLARLPVRWLHSATKQTGGITSNIVTRPEFSAHSPLWRGISSDFNHIEEDY